MHRHWSRERLAWSKQESIPSLMTIIHTTYFNSSSQWRKSLHLLNVTIWCGAILVLLTFPNQTEIATRTQISQKWANLAFHSVLDPIKGTPRHNSLHCWIMDPRLVRKGSMISQPFIWQQRLPLCRFSIPWKQKNALDVFSTLLKTDRYLAIRERVCVWCVCKCVSDACMCVSYVCASVRQKGKERERETCRFFSH